MSAESAKYLKCIRCGKKPVRDEFFNTFFSCSGSEENPHKVVLVSSKFDTESGIIEETENSRKPAPNLV